MASNQGNFVSPTATPREGSSNRRSFRLRFSSRNGSPTGTDSRRTATNDSRDHNSDRGHHDSRHDHNSHHDRDSDHDRNSHQCHNNNNHHHHHHHLSQSNGSVSASNRGNDEQSSADDAHDGERPPFPPLVLNQQQPAPPPPLAVQQPAPPPPLAVQQPAPPPPLALQQPAKKNLQAAPDDDGYFFVEVDVEFWRKFARVTAIIVGIVFLLLSLMACVIGFNAMYQCPASPFIPVALCGGGITCLIFAISIIVGESCSWRVNFSAFKILTIVLVAFMAFWLIGGSIASFNSKITTDPLLPHSYRSRYCNKTAYEFSMFILCFIYINLLALFVGLIVCAFVVSDRIMQKFAGVPLLVITYVSPNFRRLWDEN